MANVRYATLKLLIDSDAANDPPATDAAVLTWTKGAAVIQKDITYQDLMFGWAEPENTRYKLDAAFITHATTPYINSVYNSMLILRDVFVSGADLTLSRDDVRETIKTLSGTGLPFSTPNKTALFDLAEVTATLWDTQDQFGQMDDESKLYHIAGARA